MNTTKSLCNDYGIPDAFDTFVKHELVLIGLGVGLGVCATFLGLGLHKLVAVL